MGCGAGKVTPVVESAHTNPTQALSESNVQLLKDELELRYKTQLERAKKELKEDEKALREEVQTSKENHDETSKAQAILNATYKAELDKTKIRLKVDNENELRENIKKELARDYERKYDAVENKLIEKENKIHDLKLKYESQLKNLEEKLNSDKNAYQLKAKENIEFNEKWKQWAKDDENKINDLKDGELFLDSRFEYHTETFKDDVENVADDSQIEWMRPYELVTNPLLNTDKIKPEEVQQGALGDCWFLAALAALAKEPKLYQKVFAEKVNLYGFNYKGYLKVNFWQYGEWITVYIDDRLPTQHNNLIYGRNTSVNNFWVPLLEKAYAKLMGSYRNLIGGNSEKALMELTGAICLKLEPNSITFLPERYYLEEHLLQRNELIGCAAIRLSKSNAKSANDFDGHAYSLLTINKISVDTKIERVYTLRNPHGMAKEGDRWQASHPIWNKIDENCKQKVLYDGKDLLTWMSDKAIKMYFSSISLAFYTPSLNQNGHLFEFKNKFPKVTDNILSVSKYLNFQHYLLCIKSTKNPNKKADIILNLIQEKIPSKKPAGLSFTVFQIRATNKTKSETSHIGVVNYTDVPSTGKFLISHQTDLYLRLQPGYYFLIPTVSEMEHQSLRYFFRVFSFDDVTVEEVFREDNSRFETHTGHSVSILTLKCDFCNELITGPYTTALNYKFHKECHELFNLCESCGQNIKDSYYTMSNGLKYCVNCHNEHDVRINSARNKY
jgi:hypothetical protein